MMEEIDRFQVPSAVQEAEMQAEMQPLVSHIDNRSLFWSCFFCCCCNTIVIPGCLVYVLRGLPFIMLCSGIPTHHHLPCVRLADSFSIFGKFFSDYSKMANWQCNVSKDHLFAHRWTFLVNCVMQAASGLLRSEQHPSCLAKTSIPSQRCCCCFILSIHAACCSS